MLRTNAAERHDGHGRQPRQNGEARRTQRPRAGMGTRRKQW